MVYSNALIQNKFSFVGICYIPGPCRGFNNLEKIYILLKFKILEYILTNIRTFLQHTGRPQYLKKIQVVDKRSGSTTTLWYIIRNYCLLCY